MLKEHLVNAIWLSKSGFIGRFIDGTKIVVKSLNEEQLLSLLRTTIIFDDDIIVRDICNIVSNYKKLEEIISYYTHIVEKIKDINSKIISSPKIENPLGHCIIYNTIIASISNNNVELESHTDCSCFYKKNEESILVTNLQRIADMPVKLNTKVDIIKYNFDDPNEIEPMLILTANKSISLIDALSSIYYELEFSIRNYNEKI